MKELPTLNTLIDSFSKLPGVGSRSAERMAYGILNMRTEDVEEFSSALDKAAHHIGKCPICGLYSEDGVCPVCDGEGRDHSKIVVVSTQKDAISFEKIGNYDGLYHVLGGSINMQKGIGTKSLNIDALISRVEKGNIKEIILATNPTLEGETTALFIAKLLKDFPVSITRLAYGLAMGTSLEYSDSLTLSKAFEGRKIL